MPVKKNAKEKSQENRILQTFASFQNERDSIIINSIKAFMAVENINSFSAAVRKLVIEQLNNRGYQTVKPLPPELESARLRNSGAFYGNNASPFPSGDSYNPPPSQLVQQAAGFSPQSPQVEMERGYTKQPGDALNGHEVVKPTINTVESRIPSEVEDNAKQIETQTKPKAKAEIPKGGLLSALTGQGAK